MPCSHGRAGRCRAASGAPRPAFRRNRLPGQRQDPVVPCRQRRIPDAEAPAPQARTRSDQGELHYPALQQHPDVRAQALRGGPTADLSIKSVAHGFPLSDVLGQDLVQHDGDDGRGKQAGDGHGVEDAGQVLDRGGDQVEAEPEGEGNGDDHHVPAVHGHF